MTTSPFTEYRPNGWPLCPVCGEDELMSFRDTTSWQYDEHRTVPIAQYVQSGIRCVNCGWMLEVRPVNAKGRGLT